MLKFHLTAPTLLIALSVANSAFAHFKLTSPTSWLVEDSQGNPQKVGPCGTDESDTSSLSNKVTTFHAGETIKIEWTDTIAHPGHFRIALAADRKDLKDPDIKQDASCSYDESMVPKEPHGNVLADGIFFRTRNGFSAAAGMKFSQDVTLPNTPCDNCTLQVMQIMENDIQAISNCYYFHCANIKILPADGSGTAAGAGGSNSSTTAGATASASGSAAVSGAGGQGTGGTSAAGAGAAAPAGTTAAVAGSQAVAGTMAKPTTGAAGVASTTPSKPTAGTTASPTGMQSSPTTAAAGAAPASPSASTSSGGCAVTTDRRGAHQALTTIAFLLLARAAGRRRRKSVA